MPITAMKNGSIAGFKYFGFGGLKHDTKGLKSFKGAKKGNKTAFNLFITPRSAASFKVNVWLNGPWDNSTWKGKKIGEILVPANSKRELTKFTVDVARFVEGLDKKHSIFLVAESISEEPLFDFEGLGFSSSSRSINRPLVPAVNISVDGKIIELPAYPVRSTNQNGIMGYDLYETIVNLPAGTSTIPTLSATSTHPDVRIEIQQTTTLSGAALVKCNYKGIVKTYKVVFSSPES